MKLTTLACTLATLAATSSALTPQAAVTAASPSDDTAPSPTPFLEVRQAGDNYNPDATAGPSQYPIATTNWVQTSIPGGAVTYVPIAYTQKFSEIPDQLPSPGSGAIGYGTLSAHKKRQAEPVQTDIDFAQPIVVVIRNAVVTQPVQAVAVVQLIDTVMETSLGTVYVYPPPPAPTNATYGTPMGTGMPFATGYGTGNHTVSANETGLYGTGFHYGTGTGFYNTAASSAFALPTVYNRTLPFQAF